jgi:hypothetical protein
LEKRIKRTTGNARNPGKDGLSRSGILTALVNFSKIQHLPGDKALGEYRLPFLLQRLQEIRPGLSPVVPGLSQAETGQITIVFTIGYSDFFGQTHHFSNKCARSVSQPARNLISMLLHTRNIVSDNGQYFNTSVSLIPRPAKVEGYNQANGRRRLSSHSVLQIALFVL